MTHELSDDELLTAWRTGDAEAGEALFVRHYRSIARFFRNKVAPDRVADLIQETFVASVEGRDRIREGGRFSAYLLGIAYHVFCKNIREGHRRGTPVDLDEISIADIAPAAPSVVARAQEQRLLLEALRAISVNFQVVLELYYWEDLSTTEIAAVLGVPVGTVRSRLDRARDALESAMTRIASSNELLQSTLTRLDDWARELAGS
jgi:RNA polymerase sigma-70 factor (ECF subfamily)